MKRLNLRPLLPLCVVLLGAVIFFALGFQRLDRSLFLDEALTAWVVEGSLPQALHRALHFQGPPLFFIVEWFVVKLLGDSESALRILSLCIASVTAVSVFFLGPVVWRLTPLSAASAGVLFLSFDQTIEHATSARPYALAVFLVLVSFGVFEWWVRSPSLLRSFVYAASLAAIFWCHYLFGLVFVVHLACIFVRQAPLRSVCAAALFGMVLVSPLVPALILFEGRWNLYVYEELSIDNIQYWALPDGRVHPFLTVILALGVLSGRKREASALAPLSPLILWIVIGPLVFLCGNSIGIFPTQSRYFFWQALGLALFLAALMDRYLSERVRAFAAGGLLVGLAALSPSYDPFLLQDWRGAFRALSDHGVERIALWPGLAETRDVEWLRDRERSEYLRAVPHYYAPQMGIDLVSFPPFDPPNRDSTAAALNSLMEMRHETFFVGGVQVTNQFPSLDGFWIDGFERLGFRASLFKDCGSVRVYRLSRVEEAG